VLTAKRAAGILLLALTTGFTAPGCSSPAGDSTALRPFAPVSATPPPGPATPAPSPSTTAVPPATPTVTDGWVVVGRSVQGRPIRVRTLGHGPRKVLFVGGIHGNEPEGAYTTAQLPAAFTGAGLADAVTLTILEDANPDGRANGTRTNANGVDINRNFPARNFDKSNPLYGGTPLSQPESRALYNTIERIDPDLVLVAHSWAGRKFVNFDGPARRLAERFSTESGLPLVVSSSITPRPGSLGNYVGVDHGRPILTIELLMGSNQVTDWHRIRTALLHAIAG
jgi:murein peptide amidase A